MSDSTLRDQGVAELELTTDPYPTWVRKGKPSSSHWAKAFAYLDQIGTTPPPPSGMLKVAYNANSGSAHTTDWPSIQAQGFNTYICGADETSTLTELKAAGCHAWVTCGYWTGSGFSTTDPQAVSMARAAIATGAVVGFYVADEPSYSTQNVALVKTRSQLLKNACPGVETLIAYYDAASLPNWKGAVDAFALDIYPSRFNWNYSLITQLAAAADRAALKYYGVVGAFTDDSGSYPLPNPQQLQAMINTWNATKQSGRAVYAWGATTKTVSNQLQNQPGLLTVLKAANK